MTMRRDRVLLFAPIGGQLGAFVIVLVIGLLLGHHHSSHGPSSGVNFKVTAMVSSAVTAAGGSSGSKPLDSGKVAILDAGTLHRAGWGSLDRDGSYGTTLPGGSYEICLSVPAGLEPAPRGAEATQGLPGVHSPATYPGTHMLPALPGAGSPGGWDCAQASVDHHSMAMMFTLTTPAPHPQPTVTPKPTVQPTPCKSTVSPTTSPSTSPPTSPSTSPPGSKRKGHSSPTKKCSKPSESGQAKS
jgi:hypothetical protein